MPPSDPTNGAAATPPAPATVWPGSSYPLGANFDGGGTNFALFSEIAEKVELCLIDDDGGESRICLDDRLALAVHIIVNTGSKSRNR